MIRSVCVQVNWYVQKYMLWKCTAKIPLQDWKTYSTSCWKCCLKRAFSSQQSLVPVFCWREPPPCLILGHASLLQFTLNDQLIENIKVWLSLFSWGQLWRAISVSETPIGLAQVSLETMLQPNFSLNLNLLPAFPFHSCWSPKVFPNSLPAQYLPQICISGNATGNTNIKLFHMQRLVG